MEMIALSRWELGFLRTLAAPVQAVAQWSEVLDVPQLQPESDVAVAGFSSLLLRDLARVDGDAVVVSPELAAVLVGMSTASDVATVVSARDGGADAAHIFIGAEQSLLVRPRAFGTFEVSGLSDDATVATMLAAFAGAAGDDSKTVASVQHGPEVIVSGAGSFFTIDVGGAESTTTRDDLAARLALLLGARGPSEVAGG